MYMKHLKKNRKTIRNKKHSKKLTRSYLGGGKFYGNEDIIEAYDVMPITSFDTAIHKLQNIKEDSNSIIATLITKLEISKNLATEVEKELLILYEEK